MTTVGSRQARTHLHALLRAAERGETVIITRHGKPVARLGPAQEQLGRSQEQRREEVAKVIERMKRARATRPKVSIQDILAGRHEGHKY